jgi:hypothetical protein
MTIRHQRHWSAVGSSRYHVILRQFSEVSDVPAGIRVTPAEVPPHDR